MFLFWYCLMTLGLSKDIRCHVWPYSVHWLASPEQTSGHAESGAKSNCNSSRLGFRIRLAPPTCILLSAAPSALSTIDKGASHLGSWLLKLTKPQIQDLWLIKQNFVCPCDALENIKLSLTLTCSEMNMCDLIDIALTLNDNAIAIFRKNKV